MGHFRTLKDFIIKHKWRYLIGVTWLLVVDVMQLVIPRLLGNFTDALQRGNIDNGDLVLFSALILFLAGGIAFARYLWRMYIFGTARLLEYSLRNRLFSHLLNLSPSYYTRHKTGDLMARATNDLQAVRQAFGPGIVMFTDAVVLTLATVTLMAVTTNIKLTAMALLPLPFLAFVSRFFGRIIHSRFRQVQEAFSGLSGRVHENVAGIRVVKSFVQEEAEIKKFTSVNRHYLETNMHLVRVWSVFGPLVQFISAVSFLIVLGYGGFLVLEETITLGDFVAFNSYLGLLTWPVMALGFVMNMLQRGSASMERINRILEEKPEITEPANPVSMDRVRGQVEFRNVTFRYPGSENPEPVLRNVSLVVEPGQTVAVVGRTGSGKTTLVNLLLRLYPVDDGSIFIDGYDINRIPLVVLRDAVGYVPQDDFLFSKTIRENITFGSPGIPPTVVNEAARVAGIHQEILSFSHGYETLVGERGVTLSGGQKQRVSIARALAKHPRILVLDDSLSAVDTRTEEAILRSLREVRRGLTNIIISHRVSSIKSADWIVVLEAGRVVEQGRHADLLARGGVYYELYQKQVLRERIEHS